MRLCVHGLGYIGLATSSLFANNGHEVIGYDIDEDVRDRLERGEPDVAEAPFEAYVQRALDASFRVSSEPVPAEYHVICVPTPYDRESEEANLDYVESAARAIGSLLRPDDVVIIESTVPPGTTTTVVAPLLARAGLTPSRDIGLGYVPETILPGNTVTELRSNDRILGGLDPASTEAIGTLYETVPTGTLRAAPDATTAEFAKLVQNAFRDVNIAYANTLALVAEDYGIDVREAIDLANTHPRVDILDPGPGVGGHCLPVDPHFLGQGSDETDLVDTAREVNDHMPDHVLDLLAAELDTLRGKTVAVLGVAYKGNVSDTRNSPGLAIARELGAATSEAVSLADGGWREVDVRLCDPHVTDPDLDLVPVTEALDCADAAVLTAAHDEFADLDPQMVRSLLDEQVVVDPLSVVDADAWTDQGISLVTL
ncbi:MAG: nucleotide sugar dehydrogenase [Haloarcula sp.]